jgi:hypothetical protein
MSRILDPKRWAIYQTEAIEDCYSVRKFQDFGEKTAIRPKNGKLSAIIFVVFKYFDFS